jgi:hypothetical protein
MISIQRDDLAMVLVTSSSCSGMINQAVDISVLLLLLLPSMIGSRSAYVQAGSILQKNTTVYASRIMLRECSVGDCPTGLDSISIHTYHCQHGKNTPDGSIQLVIISSRRIGRKS